MDKQQENIFDGWEFALRCKKCGRQDNHDKKEPVTVLDANKKLCEFCFDGKYDE